MYYNNTPPKGTTAEELRKAKAQELKEARRRMTEEFAAMLSIDPGEGRRWTGCLTDLMEAAHIAYAEGTICDDEGRLCTFRELVSRVCLCMHVREPRNPRGYACRADRRKGVRQSPLIERYCWQMRRTDGAGPLGRFVSAARA